MSEIDASAHAGPVGLLLSGFAAQAAETDRRRDMEGFRHQVDTLPADELIQALQQIGSPGMRELARDMRAPPRTAPGEGGLSVDERREVYTQLASKLDAETLAAWTSALEDEHEVDLQAEQIHSHSSRQLQLDVIETLRPDLRAPRNIAVPNGGINAAALALSRLLSLQWGDDFRDAAKRLTDDELTSALHHAFVPRRRELWGLEGGRRLIAAAEESGDPLTQARMFASAASLLGEQRDWRSRLGYNAVADNAATRTVVFAMRHLLDRDTRGIVGELCKPGVAASGAHTALTRYATHLIEIDDAGAAATLLRQSAVLEGAGTGIDPVEFLNVAVPHGGEMAYLNARHAFTFAESVAVALKRVDGTIGRQAENFQWELSSSLVWNNYAFKQPGPWAFGMAAIAMATLGLREYVVQRAEGIHAQHREVRNELVHVPGGSAFMGTAGWSVGRKTARDIEGMSL